MLKEKLLKNKKRLTIVSAMALCLCVGTLIGGKMIVDNVKADEDLAKTGTETVTIVDKETGENEVVKADSKEAKEAKSDPNVKVTENKSSKDTSNKSSNKNSNTSSSNKTNKTDFDKNSSSSSSNKSDSNKDTGTKPSTSSNQSETSKPAHTHSWVAVTEPVYENQAIYGAKCTGCSFTNLDGDLGTHIRADKFDGCNGYGSGIVVGYENVYVGEKTVGYKCSCGARK